MSPIMLTEGPDDTGCDPNTFYEGSQQSDLEVEVTKWVNVPLALIILVFFSLGHITTVFEPTGSEVSFGTFP